MLAAHIELRPLLLRCQSRNCCCCCCSCMHVKHYANVWITVTKGIRSKLCTAIITQRSHSAHTRSHCKMLMCAPRSDHQIYLPRKSIAMCMHKIYTWNVVLPLLLIVRRWCLPNMNKAHNMRTIFIVWIWIIIFSFVCFYLFWAHLFMQTNASNNSSDSDDDTNRERERDTQERRNRYMSRSNWTEDEGTGYQFRIQGASIVWEESN